MNPHLYTGRRILYHCATWEALIAEVYVISKIFIMLPKSGHIFAGTHGSPLFISQPKRAPNFPFQCSGNFPFHFLDASVLFSSAEGEILFFRPLPKDRKGTSQSYTRAAIQSSAFQTPTPNRKVHLHSKSFLSTLCQSLGINTGEEPWGRG